MAKRKIKFSFNFRAPPEREAYDRVLIVCEGKTEVNYFKKLIECLKLNTINIEILDIKQTTPDSLFNRAKKLYSESKRQGNPFDRVYCVFDKDGYTKYQQTKNHIDQATAKGVYYYAFSEPCFEFWLLLHFIKTDRPFINFDELKKYREFKQYFPNYNKSENIFLEDKVSIACQNAKDNPPY
ncbi:hypothetical protein BHECKSOX2_259 [Bathymodiolus heckerae thiotrophic gill symbiont]|uniref:RloB family protein n=1 Tax=Bathymodiolus heckerae thiotrophic gill symbiont TaxID=1052212 RepID=UPI0010BA7C53|nr:RloB family protein [Bathymodiolus heckerae thiotrophic gill symbiont]SMN13270.1 hypothetical protein BHECKSOX2_259 [Bathymodiolus heckerae thiotrophic gill symbiont]